MKILFITPSVPYPPHTGGQLRSWYMLRELATRGEVTLVSIGGENPCEPYLPELKKYCAKALLADPIRFESEREMGQWASIRGRLGKLIRMQPWLLDDFVSPEIRRQIEAAKPEEHDLIVVRFAVMAYHMLRDKKFRGYLGKTIVDVDDLSPVVEERQLRSMKSSYRKMRLAADLVFLKRYYSRLKSAAACFVTARKDKNYLLENGMARKVFVIPNMFEVNGRKASFFDLTSDPEILFCGMMSYPPNRDAVFYFCEKILPKIQKVIPRAHFVVVGKHTQEKMLKFGSFPGVIVKGYVPSMEPYYEKAALVVVPLLNGGGSRIKILEAMTYGRPVVSTSIGAEGFDVTDGENILIADDPETFAEKCIELLHNPKQSKSIADAAYQFVKENYDVRIFHRRMDEVIEFVRRELGMNSHE